MRIKKEMAALFLSGVLLLTGCGMVPAPATTSNLQVASVNLPDVLRSAPEFERARTALSDAGIRLDERRVLRLTQQDGESYVFTTHRPDLRVIALVRDGRVLTVSLVRSADTTTVTDLTTRAVTELKTAGSGAPTVLAFGYATFGSGADSLTRVASRTTPEPVPAVTVQGGFTQCTGSVPTNLLQAREQAQNDAASYQEQLGVAVAIVAAASAAVLVACGLTVVTAGVTTPGCIAAGAAYSAAVMQAQEKTRQRDDANIRREYAQLAINQWKSDYASSHGCSW